MWCARLTGQVQGVEVLYDEGSNRSISFPEPCGHPREGMGEASAGAHVGRAIERRKRCHSECRDSHIGRRQHCSHRFGEVREGSAASKNPRTHVRTRSGLWRPPRCPALRAGPPKPRHCRVEDERRGGVRCDDSSDEAGEQSAGDRVAELVERSVAPEGKSDNPTHTVRRDKALLPCGCESHATAVVSVGSDQGGLWR